MTCRELGGPTPRGGPGAQPAGPRLPLHELTRGPGEGGGLSTAHGTSEGSDAARSHRRYSRFRPPGSHPVSGTFSSSQFGEKDHHQDRCEIPHCYVVITVVPASQSLNLTGTERMMSPPPGRGGDAIGHAQKVGDMVPPRKEPLCPRDHAGACGGSAQPRCWGRKPGQERGAPGGRPGGICLQQQQEQGAQALLPWVAPCCPAGSRGLRLSPAAPLTTWGSVFSLGKWGEGVVAASLASTGGTCPQLPWLPPPFPGRQPAGAGGAGACEGSTLVPWFFLTD